MITLSQAVEDFLADAGGRAQSTIDLYRRNLTALMSFFGGDVDLDEVQARELRAWLGFLRERPNQVRAGRLSPSYIQQHFRCARTLFAWCRRQGYIVNDPMDLVTKPKIPDKALDILEPDQIRRLFDSLADSKSPQRNVAIGYTLLDTAMRLGELCDLRVSDLKLDSCLIRIEQGKGGKGRLVPVTNPTVNALRAWLDCRDNGCLRESLFGMTPGAVYQMFRRVGKRAGLHIYPHLLRHTAASLYTGPLDDLQQILGHADVSTTAMIYRHRGIGLIRDRHAERSIVMQLDRLNVVAATATGLSHGE